MPDESPAVLARRAVEKHCEYWNARNQQAWSALFADEVVFEDPVGAPPKHGREAVRESWERSLTPGREWHLVPTRILAGGSEAAVVMRNEGNLHATAVVVETLEVWRVREDGLVVSIRAFFEPDPSVQSGYFQTTRSPE
ncbi:MAG TPA: nuclear transport factor 2 family protein [Frankiaceae bacterium]|jgi:steroid delta-isomerase|nr:nuclear transport factor 2 family protein [Frankiaceae bacterium]